MTSWVSDSQTPAWTDWNQCSSPTLGPIWPTGPSSPGIPWKKKATFLMLSPKETWNLNSSKTFCNNNLVLDITQGYFHSFCWTHLVTWFPRLSRRPLISRQTLRTHTQKNIFQKLFRTRSNQTPWTVLKLSVLLQCLKNITHREAIFTWRSLLSSVSCNTLLEDKHFCVINSNNNNKKKKDLAKSF